MRKHPRVPRSAADCQTDPGNPKNHFQCAAIARAHPWASFVRESRVVCHLLEVDSPGITEEYSAVPDQLIACRNRRLRSLHKQKLFAAHSRCFSAAVRPNPLGLQSAPIAVRALSEPGPV